MKPNFFIISINSLALLLGFSFIAKANASPANHINVNQEANIIRSQAKDINPRSLRLGLKAYDKALQKGLVHKPYLTIIDYSRKSTEKRLWVIDVKHHTVPFHTYVSHGKNSGKLTTTRFSNQSGSHASSLGVFLTKGTYFGGKGYSLRLTGLEKGFNDHALARSIVVHGAWYAGENFARQNGYLGRSWGCPAVPKQLAKPIINTIKNGSVIFAYFPQQNWISHSNFLA